MQHPPRKALVKWVLIYVSAHKNIFLLKNLVVSLGEWTTHLHNIFPLTPKFIGATYDSTTNMWKIFCIPVDNNYIWIFTLLIATRACIVWHPNRVNKNQLYWALILHSTTPTFCANAGPPISYVHQVIQHCVTGIGTLWHRYLFQHSRYHTIKLCVDFTEERHTILSRYYWQNGQPLFRCRIVPHLPIHEGFYKNFHITFSQ